MANYQVPKNPVYNADNIRMLRDSDPASATNTFNPLFQHLINNTHAVKQISDALQKQVSILTGYEISGTVNTFADLPSLEGIPIGILFLVLSDETRKGKTTIYELNSDSVWVFVTELESNSKDIVLDHDKDPNAHSILINSIQEQIKGEKESIENHMSNEEIHISEEERKVLEDIMKDFDENPSTGNRRDVIRVSMQTGFTYSLDSLDRYTNKVLIPITFNTRTSIPKVSIIGDFTIQTSTGLIELESLEVKSTSYNYVVLEGVLKSNYPLNSPVILLSSENSEIKIDSPILSGVDVEEIKATEDNQISAFIGFTHNLNDKELNEYGEVDKVLITVPFNIRDNVPNITIVGDFLVQTGSCGIKLSDLQVIDVTKGYALLEGTLEEPYPINSPIALVFDSVKSKIVVKD